jgi:hypothetical protein
MRTKEGTCVAPKKESLIVSRTTGRQGDQIGRILGEFFGEFLGEFLGEFSPIRQLFALGSFFKVTLEAQFLGLLFS